MDIFKKSSKPRTLEEAQSKPLTLEEAREMFDLFNWDNIEFVELEGWITGDMYKPFRNMEIRKCIKHRVLINNPLKENFNYIIAKNNDMNIYYIHAGLKSGKEICLDILDRV